VSLALVPGLAPGVRAQAAPDTLLYHVAVLPAQRHLSVEGRLTVQSAGGVPLVIPPRAASAGTSVAGFAATDDRGTPLHVQRTGSGYVVEGVRPGAIRFRYRLDFNDSVSSGSTASGLDPTRLYAITRSVFVAPDPVANRKTWRPFPFVRVRFVLPDGWRLITSWDSAGGEFQPRSGDDLMEGALAAAADYRTYSGAVDSGAYTVAVRGQRAFPDSALVDLIAASLRHGTAAFGPVPVSRVVYISDAGRKGRTSGSLQGTSAIGLLWEPGEMLERPRGHDTFHETLHLWFGGAMEAERWWTEGVTDYFAARFYAEWQGDPRDLAALCYESWRNYQRIPDKTAMTMAEESRARPGGDNTSLLVYRKGMLAGLLLDAAVRRGSGGRARLDDVARGMLAIAAQRTSRTIGATEMRAAVIAAGGAPASRAWDRVVAGTDPISQQQVAEALRVVTGVELQPPRERARPPKALANSPNQRETP
jgi:predicted metalloprotease with PDZ domain